ncbi:MAG TPA: xylulokinase [Burkholderiaceae bacterium]|nr:xylulokinase [Burkholderiaceae bacterium]
MFIGIDLGTSEVKVVLLDREQRLVAVAREPLAVSRPRPLWSEQAPEDWWAAACRALDALAADHAQQLRRVEGIGLSGQMHGAVAMDAHDRVLRPAILWNDGRSGAECEELMRREPRLTQIAGNLAMPGFTAPKLVWMSRHEPQLFAAVRTVLLPKDWLRWRLTGEKVSDMSDAAGTLWLDVARRDWSDALLAACGMDRSQMPSLVEGSDPGGRLRPEWARRWGIPASAVVAGGAGDNAASAVGIGAVRPGQGFLSLGTSGVLFVCDDRFRPNPGSAVHAFCHALPGRWHQMSVMLSAAGALAWGAQVCGRADVGAWLDEIESLDAGSMAQAPIFLPYLSGERTPHNDPLARGVLFGLAAEHTPASMAYAAMEGVSFGLRDGLQALRQAGTEIARLSLVGGGARSTRWAQLLADVLEVEIVTHEGGEAGAALGAARLAWLAAGGDETAVCTVPPVAAVWRPRERTQRDYLQARYDRFRALYPALRPHFPGR